MSAGSPRFPAEWERQHCVWIAWPERPELWSGRFAAARETWALVALAIARFEPLRILARDATAIRRELEDAARRENAESALYAIEILPAEPDDVWVRDYGPLALLGPDFGARSAVKFHFTGWGGKFEPYDGDNRTGESIAARLGDAIARHPAIIEGGAIESNGAGLLMTTESVLLNANRHPGKTRADLEAVLHESLHVNEFIWLKDGLPGDDTDGHIDMIARFTGPRRVLAALPDDARHPAWPQLRENLDRLERFRDSAGAALEIATLPAPPQISDGDRLLPRSYANFLIINDAVIVPVYHEAEDERALAAIAREFPERTIVPVFAGVMLLEGGGVHCMSLQTPDSQVALTRQ